MEIDEDDKLRLESQPLPEGADPDNAVVVDLERLGSDVSKLHLIEFFLYFPEQASAQQAAARIREAGSNADVATSPNGSDWLVLASKTMVPDLADIQQIRRDFSVLATSLNGQYDGWETGIVK